ncbi:hypothetical protein LR948_16170 [Roseivivax sp. GX 12232]|uniref:hypothetical protein n=1 Tax=Roseivivax sp. GX 12232 TaxID=2900547 RepID=UPI001E3AF214|nr:hypothetical protein [Roseivivax sp. GX 12232]MCE0506908.1 hypothetical protein [Roseivivax sp. GX 12232]
MNDVLSFYRLILRNPSAMPVSYATDETNRFAWRLAECEAQVDRATAAERAHFFGRFAHTVVRTTAGDADATSSGDLLQTEELQQIIAADSPDMAQLVHLARENAFWREAHRLQRYRREAETARRRALRDYLRAAEAEPCDPCTRFGLARA